MELEGHGGVVRGQEVYEDLPAEALAASGHGSRCAEGVLDARFIASHGHQNLT